MERILHMLNEWTWGVPMLVLMLASGLTFTLATRFVQFRRFGTVMKTSVCSVFSHPDQPGALSPFQAVATALAATVGTGNIAGVAGAIALGGPGAMFWMWVSALLGMATKYAEVLLSVHFRQRNSRGEWVGGPMYTILNGLGSRWKPLAMLFAALGAASAFGIGNMAQINTVTSVITGVVISLDPAAIGVRTPIARTVGILALFFCALVLLGGTQRIGKCTELLVPLMSAAYICATLWILITNAPMLKTVLVRIFQGAFKPESVIGGAAGIGIRQTIRLGIGRGVFSNEAGLGSAPIAYASAATDDPARQGLMGIFEVFVDTLVLSTLTGLSILASPVFIPYGQAVGADLTLRAFSATFGDIAAGTILAGGMTLFALSTILSWSLYGLRCVEFLFGAKARIPYLFCFLLAILPGSGMELGVVWTLSDLLNGWMALPNLLSILLLRKTVVRLSAHSALTHASRVGPNISKRVRRTPRISLILARPFPGKDL